ncbi:hypothetical protein KRR38_21085 [Novosphingobium sp. G106]|uniref:hypothetical protein n=1 Tax=Novosphingobium sp. G106 TaxID=2849500 RepID=UPI001C2D01E3|nr:hypothetical protein [Novosphingobium sp. G106]MBV1690108.1 hypothetical protein [Novosphingobium sp. G106]
MSFDRIEKKIVRPPAAHNVARLLDPESELKTTDNIARFALSIPAFNYVSALKVCFDRVALGIDIETAVNAVRQSGAPSGRIQNEQLVRAFFKHDEMRKYSNLKVLDSYRGQFMISRDISVPTVPTFTVFESGRQVPVVICGWKSFNLRRDQIRAWLSMLESGLFSFADYRGSPWEILLLPDAGDVAKPAREARVIRSGEYNLFSEAELRELAAMYARAQKAAMPIARELWHQREQRRREKERDLPSRPGMPDRDSPPDLFAKGDDED